MPTISTPSKIAGTKLYTDHVIFSGSTSEEREAKVDEVIQETGAILIPPYDHPDIILGQGTTALELQEQYHWLIYQSPESTIHYQCQTENEDHNGTMESGHAHTVNKYPVGAALSNGTEARLENPYLDAVIAPLGGGGLLSGIATYFSSPPSSSSSSSSSSSVDHPPRLRGKPLSSAPNPPSKVATTAGTGSPPASVSKRSKR